MKLFVRQPWVASLKAVTAAVIGTALLSQHVLADYRIGGINGGQGWSWSKGGQTAFRAAVENPANFGPNGKVKTRVLTQVLPDVRPANLAMVHCFVAPADLDTLYSQQDLGNIKQFFLQGGDLLLMNDGAAYDAIGAFLGVPSTQNNLSDSTGSGKPLFSGPFGSVTSIKHQALNGLMVPADIAATGGMVLGSNGGGPTIAFWPRSRFSPGSGALVIISDVDVVASPGNGYSGGMANYQTMNANAVLALNAVAALILKAPISDSVGIEYATLYSSDIVAIEPADRGLFDPSQFNAVVFVSASSSGFVDVHIEFDGNPKGSPKRFKVTAGPNELRLPIPSIPKGAHIISVAVRGRNLISDYVFSYGSTYDPNEHGLPFDNHQGLLSYNGLCVGMSYASARRYLGQVPDDIWNDSLLLEAYVQATDVAVKLSAPFLVKEAEMFAINPAIRNGYLRDQIRLLRLGLTPGDPVILVLGDSEDAFATRHCVVAQILFDLGSGHYNVGIYDPNYGPIPGRDGNVVQRIWTSSDTNGLEANLDSDGGASTFDFFTVFPSL